MSIFPLQLIRVNPMWGLALSLLSDEPPSSLNSDNLLREAVAQIAQDTVALPKFTCTETVERSF